MRPRVFPAEDFNAAAHDAAHNIASMRPRVFPAEDPRGPGARAAGGTRFNEAAGIPRGRHRYEGENPEGYTASMRPRVFPAEDKDYK